MSQPRAPRTPPPSPPPAKPVGADYFQAAGIILAAWLCLVGVVNFIAGLGLLRTAPWWGVSLVAFCTLHLVVVGFRRAGLRFRHALPVFGVLGLIGLLALAG